VIDDLADRRHDCDLLLDQNFVAAAEGRYDVLVPAACRKLVGPRYAMLRPGFSRQRAALRHRDGAVRRVLVFLGGVDKDDLTGRAIDLLQKQAGLEVDVVVGQGNPRRSEIERRCAGLPGFQFFCQVADMELLMAKADLAIGGGGVALLERCSLGLPSILLALADNQLAGCRALAGCGGALFVDASDESLAAALSVCRSSPELMVHMAAQAAGVTDGAGLGRVVGAMLGGAIELRRAVAGDCEQVWRWRNDPTTRRYSGDASEIGLDGHRSWFAAVLEDAGRDLLIGTDPKGEVGVLRYDVDGDEALISVYLVPDRHGQGLGSRLIEAGSSWVRKHRSAVRRIRALIGAANAASLRAFEKAGFEPNEYVYMKKLDEE
jgi:spore coat polysaccharide biosynthesis predicted glycosyltransferase SpsG/RimJ/RimL family protein N-acetyltransferase